MKNQQFMKTKLFTSKHVNKIKVFNKLLRLSRDLLDVEIVTQLAILSYKVEITSHIKKSKII